MVMMDLDILEDYGLRDYRRRDIGSVGKSNDAKNEQTRYGGHYLCDLPGFFLDGTNQPVKAGKGPRSLFSQEDHIRKIAQSLRQMDEGTVLRSVTRVRCKENEDNLFCFPVTRLRQCWLEPNMRHAGSGS